MADGENTGSLTAKKDSLIKAVENVVGTVDMSGSEQSKDIQGEHPLVRVARNNAKRVRKGGPVFFGN